MKNSWEPKYPPPPRGLSAEARGLWKRITRKWDLHLGELQILRMACESLDEHRKAQAEVEKHGRMIADRFGQWKVNPCCLVARDSLSAHLRALKTIGLKDEAQIKATRRPGRPVAVYPIKPGA